jgi:hypothetical protein
MEQGHRGGKGPLGTTKKKYWKSTLQNMRLSVLLVFMIIYIQHITYIVIKRERVLGETEPDIKRQINPLAY